jgi:hypothetical protein
MKKHFSKILFSSAMAICLCVPATATPLYFSNLKYSPGDLVLTFQKIGSTNTVYVNIGNAATKFRGTASGPTGSSNQLDIIDISATLTTAFGAGWQSDTGIYVGAVGVYSTDDTTEDVVDGDPARTVYVSKSRTAVGTVGLAGSTAWNLATGGDTSMSTASNNIFASNNVLETREADSFTTIALTEDSQIDDQNPFLTGTIQGAGYGVFGGGVQQVGSAASFGTFGAAGSVEFALDLYRMLALEGLPGQIAGTGNVRRSTYEGTITVGTNGKVSFISQAAATSAYDTWMATFPSITAAADKLPTADPDKDGATNLEEFGFGGNPSNGSDKGFSQTFTVDSGGDSQKDLSLTLEVRNGATFSLSSGDQVSATVDELVYRIEGSTDLVNWNSPVSVVTTLPGSGTASSGYVLKTFRLDNSSGLVGKGFLRASVTK